MKEHQIREMVNELRDVATAWHGTRQLRERIAHVVRKYLEEPQAEEQDFNPDWDAMAVLVEENQRLAKHLSELKDWEAIAADQAATIAMVKSEQAEFQELVAKVQELEKQACEIIRREWVSLSDEEIAEAVGSPIDEVYLADFRKVEAKLKEKNHVG